jgi:hypothetical protein
MAAVEKLADMIWIIEDFRGLQSQEIAAIRYMPQGAISD